MEGWWAASYIVLWLVVAALCAVVVALARQIGTLHLRLGPRGALEMDDEGPPLGEAPQLVAARAAATGESVSLGGPGRARLLLFASPGCMVCEQVLPGLGALGRRAGMAAFVVSQLDVEEANASFTGVGGRTPVLAAPDAFLSWSIPGTPYVVVLDESGSVRAKGTPNNLEQMEGLVDSARRRMAGVGLRESAR
ncbi:MAG TPA: hypothetical protein VHK89_03055 [Actinomycetota bacterium]|nr:hypothetical protein [Actinomycetota bacterium]